MAVKCTYRDENINLDQIIAFQSLFLFVECKRREIKFIWSYNLPHILLTLYLYSYVTLTFGGSPVMLHQLQRMLLECFNEVLSLLWRLSIDDIIKTFWLRRRPCLTLYCIWMMILRILDRHISQYPDINVIYIYRVDDMVVTQHLTCKGYDKENQYNLSTRDIHGGLIARISFSRDSSLSIRFHSGSVE